MRKFVITILAVIGLSAASTAQEFNPSFTAEQTIQYINQIAQSGIMYVSTLPLAEIKFSGTSSIQKSGKDADYTLKIEGINWASLTSVRSEAYEWDKNQHYVFAKFSSPCKKTGTLYTKNNTQIYSANVYYDNSFSIKLPPNETEKVENLKKAFIHL